MQADDNFDIDRFFEGGEEDDDFDLNDRKVDVEGDEEVMLCFDDDDEIELDEAEEEGDNAAAPFDPHEGEARADGAPPAGARVVVVLPDAAEAQAEAAGRLLRPGQGAAASSRCCATGRRCAGSCRHGRCATGRRCATRCTGRSTSASR